LKDVVVYVFDWITVNRNHPLIYLEFVAVMVTLLSYFLQVPKSQCIKKPN